MSMMVLGAVALIACNVVVALLTGNDLRARRAKLAKLEERREQIRSQLSQVEEHRRTAEGTRAMHSRLKEEKRAEIARQQQILGELEEITEEDREIKVASEEKEAEPPDAHEIRTRIPSMNRKPDEKPEEAARSIRMRTPKR